MDVWHDALQKIPMFLEKLKPQFEIPLSLCHAAAVHITQTRPCNILQYFTAVQMISFR